MYLLYDLVYWLDRTTVYVDMVNRCIEGYLLIWRGWRPAIHLWGFSTGLDKYIPLDSGGVIQVYNDSLLNDVVGFLESKCRVSIEYYLDMIVDESSFKPYHPEKAIHLNPSNKLHVAEFARLKKVQGRLLSLDEAVELLKTFRYYGSFHRDKLVSIACSYLRLPEVWVIGDVFTHPDYRGLGYGKIVTSAITRDSITSGAKAFLHVREDNKPAIRIYEKLGYRVLREKPWITYCTN